MKAKRLICAVKNLSLSLSLSLKNYKAIRKRHNSLYIRLCF